MASTASALRLASALAVLAALASPAAAQAPQDTRDRNPANAKAGTYTFEHDHSRIVWTASHHGYSHFSSMFTTITGTLVIDPKDVTKTTLDVSVDLTKPITGIEVFEGRLRGESWFDTAKYPAATFKSTNVVQTSGTTATVTGNLTLHGMTRPETLYVTFNQAGAGPGANTGYRLGFDGTMKINRYDYGMTFDPTVSHEVALQIEAEFVPKQ